MPIFNHFFHLKEKQPVPEQPLPDDSVFIAEHVVRELPPVEKLIPLKLLKKLLQHNTQCTDRSL